MSKNKFSSFNGMLNKIRKISKKQAKNVSNPKDDFWVGFAQLNNQLAKQSGLPTDLSMIDIFLTFEFCQKKQNSVFVDDLSTVDFLKENKVSAKDKYAIAVAIESIREVSKDGLFELHLLGEDQSIYCYVGEFPFPLISGNKRMCVAFKRSDDVCWSWLDDDYAYSNTGDESQNHAWQIVLNLFLYVSAFPELLVDGAPNLAKKK